MPTILRIDVDHAYENRILHYARVNQITQEDGLNTSQEEGMKMEGDKRD